MALLFLGKLLIALGLCFQAYLLFSNATIAGNFNSSLTKILVSCDCVPAHVKPLIQQHLRMVVVGLLGLSALMVAVRASFIKILVVIGYVTLVYVRFYPLKQLPPLSDTAFYENVAIIGGLIYLIGADRSPPATTKSKQQ